LARFHEDDFADFILRIPASQQQKAPDIQALVGARGGTISGGSIQAQGFHPLKAQRTLSNH
jgi:hypothetical protein